MKEIAPHIYEIKLGMVNAFVIEDNGLTLVDTGYRGSMKKIFSAVSRAHKNPQDIKQIILTHCHPDHAGSAASISKKLGIPVYAHELEAPLIEQGIPGRSPVHLTPGFFNWMIFQLFIRKGPKSNEPIAVEERLTDGDTLPLAGGLQVIHTPGHSAGHLSLLVKGEGLLIAGDICAHISGLAFSTVYEDPDLGLKSILKTTSHSFDKAVFGHGNPLLQHASTKIKEKFATYKTNGNPE